MSNLPSNYKLARLSDSKGDLTKPWFVGFYFLNSETKKFQRFRTYQGFENLKTAAERYQFANKLIAFINNLLQLKGWNPFQNPYTDFIQLMRYPGLYVAPLPENTIEHYLKLQLKEKEHILRKKTYQTYVSRITNFLDFLNSQNMLGLNIQDVNKHLARKFVVYLVNEKRFGNTYVNCHSSTLRTIFEDLIEREIISINPFNKIKALRESPTGFKYFEKHHIETIKPEIVRKEEQLWLFINFMVYCFIRPQELRFLKVSDIYFDRQIIQIRAEISKNRKTQMVKIPNELFSMIEKHELKKCPSFFYIFGKGGKPSQFSRSYNYFRQKHNSIIRGLGFDKDYSLYSWKHTGMILAKENGVDAADIQTQARHHSLDQVTTYFKSRGFFDGDDSLNKLPKI